MLSGLVFRGFARVLYIDLVDELFQKIFVKVSTESFSQRSELCRCCGLGFLVGNGAHDEFDLPNDSARKTKLYCALFVGVAWIGRVGLVSHVVTSSRGGAA